MAGQEILSVIRRMHLLIGAGLLLSCAVLISVLARAADAQETCAAKCLEAYAACYVRTKNRSQCEQLREACIRQCKKP
jgi:hypothetical protein